MATFTYTFEEFPLAIVGGIEAGLINGQAEIEYGRSGEWTVGVITLEGMGERVNGVRQWPQIACPEPIADIIRKRLETEWCGRVDDAIDEQIERDHEDAVEQRADWRREHRMVL